MKSLRKKLYLNFKSNPDGLASDRSVRGAVLSRKVLRDEHPFEAGAVDAGFDQCSVNSGTGVIGQCVWVFAASNEELNPSTGEFSVQTQTWSCQSPLASGTTLASLLTAISGTSPLYATLPGTSTTIYDGLVDCL